MEREPDVRVTFYFNGTRQFPMKNGYRPAHLVKNNYLTTGVHDYFGVKEVAPDGTVEGTITFITPEAYPHCLWIGKEIYIQEGARIIGKARIMKIYNKI